MDKATLTQYKNNRLEIIQLREEIDALVNKLSAPGIAKYNSDPSGGGGPGDPVGNGVAALDALRARYEQKLDELCRQQEEIEAAIDQLDNELRTIMRYRYILGYKWEAICDRMANDEGPMDWTTIHRKHRKALEIIEGRELDDVED